MNAQNQLNKLWGYYDNAKNNGKGPLKYLTLSEAPKVYQFLCNLGSKIIREESKYEYEYEKAFTWKQIKNQMRKENIIKLAFKNKTADNLFYWIEQQKD